MTLRAGLVTAAIAAIAMAWAAIVRSGGWGSILWVPVCVVAGACHIVLLIRMLANTSGNARLALLSSAMFVLAFMLQVDVGDGPGWIIGTALFEGGGDLSPLPGWWPGWVNLLAFLPLVVTWGLMIRHTARG